MEKSTGMITLNPDAWDLFKVSMEEVEKSFREDQFETVEAWRGKYNGNLLRICGLLHASMSTDPVGEPVPAAFAALALHRIRCDDHGFYH